MPGHFEALPAGLPVPIDDGACDHLVGRRLPPITLPATSGEMVALDRLAGTVVLFFYPRTGRPGEPSPEGWDAIPGARGCTPQSCAFRDRHSDLHALGATVHGVSAQDTAYQREAALRLRLPFSLLADPELRLAEALDLPTFSVARLRLYKRVTLVAEDAMIAQVFYPIFPPDRNAEDVIAWLSSARQTL